MTLKLEYFLFNVSIPNKNLILLKIHHVQNQWRVNKCFEDNIHSILTNILLFHDQSILF